VSAGRRTAGAGEPPLLAAPHQSWLELFYDLVIVAAVLVLSSIYARDSSIAEVVWLALVFGMIWSTWVATTLLTNRVRLAGTTLRSLLVLQMVLVLALVLTADDHLADNTSWTGPLFAAVLVVVAALYHLVRRDNPELRDPFRHRAGRVLAAAAVFAVTPLVPGDWYAAAWLAALAVVVLPGREERPPLDAHHLVHRFGELTIVILGETFVKIGLVATEDPLADLDLWVLPMAFVLMFAIWWLYFTDVPASGLPGGRHGVTIWTLLHLPLHLAVVGLAVGVAKLLTAHAESGHHGPGGIRFLALPLLLVGVTMVGFNVLAGTAANRRRAWIHVGSVAATLAVLALGSGVEDLPPEVVAVLLTAVVVATAVATRRYALLPDREVGDGDLTDA
jgi:low temperature requirement protein LtrA